MKVHKVIPQSLRTNQKINVKSPSPMNLNFLKAYSIVNVSDLFLENKMKDGKTLEPFDINFYKYDHKWILDENYDTLLSDMRFNKFDGEIDHQITKELNLKLQITILSSI